MTVRNGTIVKVTARGNGGAVGGTMDDTSTSWQSRWALSTGKQYVVRVTAVDADGRDHQDEPVPHAQAADHRRLPIYEGKGQTYGVGMPVMLSFSKPVENKKAVEKALVLTSSKPVVGAWYWNGDQALLFRPRNYWPQNIKLSFTGHLDGVQISSGVYTTHTLHQSWRIGRSLILVASTSDHHMDVYEEGQTHGGVEAHQHRTARPRHAQRHLPLHREGQPAAHGRRRLRPPGAVLGAVHLERRLRPRGVLVGRVAGVRQRQPRLRQRRAEQRGTCTTRGPSPATRSRSPAAPSPARGTTATPSGSSAGSSCGRAAPRTWRCA